MIAHHLPADWIVAAANGSIGAAESVLVATHVTLCPSCRARLDLAESVASGALTRAAPVALDPDGLDAVLARLDGHGDGVDEGSVRPVPSSHGRVHRAGIPRWPRPVLELAGDPSALRWRWLAPFIRGVDLPVPTTGLPLRLIRMTPGAHVPHRHGGHEAAVVLEGGWTDQTGHYGAGDFAAFTPEMEVHDQRIDDGDPCVALVLNEATAEHANPFTALVARWFFQI